MSDIIRLLPDSVANLIAAGEVIQRPASVVKELVENAVDAGADNIQIILKDAGRTLIQVIDNGCGMSPTDARMAFERHATSKIKQATDLFSLTTMGFRGEALATIASVADVDLRTMPHGESYGTRLLLTDNKVEDQHPETCVPGTNMMVKNLFNRLPARRKFLKKDAVELSHVIHEFERLALVNLDVEFTLMHNGTILHQFPKSNLKQRVSDLFGKSVGQQLIPVETETSLVKITGFVGMPENARRRNALQYFFVNGRHMRHPYFHRAVMQCYERLIPADCHPVYFLTFSVDPASIDVNIHPTKNEIKFENEQAIWQILAAAVRESLGRFNAVPAIDFNQDDAPEIPAFDPSAGGAANVPLDPNYNPFTSPYASSMGALGGAAYQTRSVGASPAPSRSVGTSAAIRHTTVPSNWDSLYANFQSERDTQPATQSVIQSRINDIPSTDSLPLEIAPEGMTAVQLAARFIITPGADGLLIVDQHRAHERVLYERFINMIESGEIASQRLIFPETVELSAAQDVLLESIEKSLADTGWDLSRIGPSTWAINGAPSVIQDKNPAETLLAIVDDFAATGRPVDEEMLSRLATTMARAAAIKPGQILSAEEIDRLLSDLFSLSTPTYTSDGRTVIATLPLTDLTRLF
ncbi:MAG: DNA mismatch repair endonuclease MutL [Bacteroidales bacterium]|nr:DNA mismatch repair endonuclease MutL [Bacteroidales bacterium]